jgi:hypothetical protein
MDKVKIFFLCLAYIFLSRLLVGNIIGPVSVTILSTVIVVGVILFFSGSH